MNLKAKLIQAISEANPCGESIKYTSDYNYIKDTYGSIFKISLTKDEMTEHQSAINKLYNTAIEVINNKSKDLDIMFMLGEIILYQHDLMVFNIYFSDLVEAVKKHWINIFPSEASESVFSPSEVAELRINIVNKYIKKYIISINKFIYYHQDVNAEELLNKDNLEISIRSDESEKFIDLHTNILSKFKDLAEFINDKTEDFEIDLMIFQEEFTHLMNMLNAKVKYFTAESEEVEEELDLKQEETEEELEERVVKKLKVNYQDLDNQELIDQIYKMADTLKEDRKYNVIAKVILYVIDALNVDSLSLLKKVNEKPFLQQIIQDIIASENADQDQHLM